MSRPNLSIVPPSELISYTSTTDFTEAPLSPNTPMSPASRRKHESTWDRIQRLKRDAEAFHERRRASSAAEPPLSLSDLEQEVVKTRIKEEEEDKQLEKEEEKAHELERQKQEEKRKAEELSQGDTAPKTEQTRKKEEETPKKAFKKPSALMVSAPTEGSPHTPKTPTTPKTPRSPFHVSAAEPAEVTDDLKMLWGELREQKTELLWVLLGYSDTKSRKVVIRGIGTAKEGIADLKTKLEVKAVQFGALRVIGVDEHAKRPKFVGFALVGSELTPSQKLQAVHAKEIQRDLFTGIHVMEFTTSQGLEIQISKKLAAIEKSVISYDFGASLVVSTSSLSSSS